MKLAFSITVALLLSNTSISYATALYQITDLGTLGGTSSRAYGIHNNGNIVGRSQPLAADGTNGTRSAFLYSNNQMQNLGNFGGSNTIAMASNSSQQVIGYSRPTVGRSEYNAFLYENGQLNNLGTLGDGIYSYAYGINEAGQIAGYSHTNASGTTSQAFIYQNGVMTGIGTLGGKSSGAFDINENGIMVGTSTTSSADTQGFVYANGVMSSLGALDGTGYSEARAINDNNQITGYSLSQSGQYHTFLYENGVMSDIGSIEGDSFAYDINNAGEIVGNYRSHLLESHGQAYIYKDGQMLDLTSLLSASDQQEWNLIAANGINDSGQIVGWGSVNGETHAYLLTTVPVPASVSLMFSALGLLGFIGKKHNKSYYSFHMNNMIYAS